MFCYKKENNLINKVHKRALRTIYDNRTLGLQELLAIDNTVSIHVRHLQILMTETFKSIHSESPEIMCKLFQLKNRPYNLRGQSLLKIPIVKTLTHGTNSLFFKASILWNLLPNEYKKAQSVSQFKNKIRKWLGNFCKCRICK